MKLLIYLLLIPITAHACLNQKIKKTLKPQNLKTWCLIAIGIEPSLYDFNKLPEELKNEITTTQALLHYILDSGCNIDKALTKAVIQEKSKAYIEGLLNLGAHYNLKDNHNNSLLHKAIALKNNELTNILINYVDPNIQNNEGITCLMLAADQGNTEIVELLLSRGASIDLQDITQDTALIKAVRENHVQTIQCLLAHKANTQLKTVNNHNALTIALLNNYSETIALLLDHYSTEYSNKLIIYLNGLLKSNISLNR